MKSITPITAAVPASFRIAFLRRFAKEPRIFSAPGRVNLIGEHTDYNDGFVLPIAIQQRTLVAAAATNDSTLRVYSSDLDEEGAFDLSEPYASRRGNWLDYVEGVARTLSAKGIRVPGAELMITSEVPRGAGLSSSAALELALALALSSLSGSALPPVELALVGQRAEHDFVGVKCGIMDQLASAIAKADHALLIDCKDQQATLVELPLESTSLLLCDTGARHSHTVSGYNQRREECESALAVLSQQRGLRSLREVTLSELPELSALLPSPLFERVRHVVSENQRTLDAVRALGARDLVSLGKLMHASHESLRRDYEVSCPELDHVVEVSKQHDAVLGARLTGGGFGGSAILLVQERQLVSVSELIASSFKAKFGYVPELRVVAPSDGMREEIS